MATYAAAGHPPLLLWRRATGTVSEFKENGLVLAVLAHQQYPNMQFALEPGDRIIMCTDGVLEAENAAKEIFGDQRLTAFLRSMEDVRRMRLRVRCWKK